MLSFFAGMSSNENNLLVSIWAGNGKKDIGRGRKVSGYGIYLIYLVKHWVGQKTFAQVLHTT